jgi:transcriptional regulator with XRE-family HTH domain
VLNEADADSKILAKFGSRVRELRQGKCLSQEAFAEACDLDRTYIGSVERGERNISLRNIERIAMSLGITVADLMAHL